MDKPVCLFDDPAVLDFASNNCPASNESAYQVVASTPAEISRIHPIDGAQEHIALLVGAPGSEVVIYPFGNPNDRMIALRTPIPAGSRLSIRSLTTSRITTGTLFCAFFSP
jgi:hypothetical protein